jgi:hypothetical protein
MDNKKPKSKKNKVVKTKTTVKSPTKKPTTVKKTTTKKPTTVKKSTTKKPTTVKKSTTKKLHVANPPPIIKNISGLYIQKHSFNNICNCTACVRLQNAIICKKLSCDKC